MAGMITTKQRAGLAATFERSGLTRRDFCERHGIPLSTLDFHRRLLRESGLPRLLPVRVRPVRVRPVRVEPVRIEPVRIEPEPDIAIAGIAVVLTNGRRIELTRSLSAEQFTYLIRTLDRA